MNTIQKYLESPDVTKLAKSTRDLYGYALGHLWDFLNKDPAWIDTVNMPGFAAYLESKNLSGKSIQQYLTCTKIFLKWAGYPTDFTYKISNEDRQTNKRKHLDRWFSKADIDKCLAYKFENCNGSSLMYRVIVRLLEETGCRVGELATVTIGDIHIEDRYLFVHGKTEPRPVIISDETAMMLDQYLATIISFSPDMKVFPQVGKIKAVITKMLENLGLKNGNDGRGPHTFRHYTATYLFYQCDMRLEDIAFLLGDKVETIRERYLHPTPGMLRDRVYAAWNR